MIRNLNPYPAYKDSGVPWLDKMPAHWGLERAKSMFVKMDRPVRPFDETVTCFRDGMVTLRKNRRLEGFTESLKEIGYQGVRIGDLVIHAMDAFAGAVGVSDSDGKCTPVYSICLPQNGVSAEYYALIVREMARSQWILALAKGIRERSTDFRYEAFSTQHVPVPPVNEQHAIARFLDHVDRRVNRYIRAKRKLIALLNEQKQAIIHRAVTRGLDPDVPLRPSGVEWLGDIPAHWEVKALKRWVSTKITDGPHETPQFFDEGVPFMSAESMIGGRLDFSKRRGFISEELHMIYCRKCQPKRDDIFMCKSGATTGKVAIVDTDREFSVWSPLALIRADQDKVIPKLLFLVLQAFYIQRQVQETWSYGTQPNLSMKAMENIMIALPALTEQQHLLLHLEEETNAIDRIIYRSLHQIDLIREYRTRLIADVVTGKLDVRAAAAALPQELAGDDDEEADITDDGQEDEPGDEPEEAFDAD